MFFKKTKNINSKGCELNGVRLQPFLILFILLPRILYASIWFLVTKFLLSTNFPIEWVIFWWIYEKTESPSHTLAETLKILHIINICSKIIEKKCFFSAIIHFHHKPMFFLIFTKNPLGLKFLLLLFFLLTTVAYQFA